MKFPELQNSVNRRIMKANPRQTGGNTKDANLMERLQPDLDRLDQLANKKVELAQRLVTLMSRTCGRLEYDLNRVRKASGEIPANPEPVPPAPRAVERVVETVKAAIAIPEPAPSPPSVPGGPAFKRTPLAL